MLDAVDRALLSERDTALWELFHENSKTSRYERHPTFGHQPSDATVVAVMRRLRRVKPYADAQKIALPTRLPARLEDLAALLRGRQSARAFGAGAVALEELAAVLALGYGMTRDNTGTVFPRPFRVIPSGGALYPLELYLYAARVTDLPAGLYHYDPEDQSLDVLRQGDELATIAGCLVQSDLAARCAAVCFVSAVFGRSTFKYGDRGYRFVLLEAGHLAQNAIVAAQQAGIQTVPIGGYLDRDVDRYLRIDGINESTIYILLLGRS